MKVALSGSGGFIGGKLKKQFLEMGYEVVALRREDLYGSPEQLAEKIKGASVVVHLAGTPVMGRWTNKYRQKIYSSRIDTTRNLVQAMKLTPRSSGIFITASAVGIYADHGVHSESSVGYADDFLGQVCRDWEGEASLAPEGVRVVHFRFGVILDKKGGALPKMALPFRFYAGGRIGSGKQFISWVHIDDVLKIFRFVIDNHQVSGAVNVVAPNPVTNMQFTHTLAALLKKPACFTVPEFGLKLLFGKGAEILTKGQAAIPEKLLNLGYKFRFAQLHHALTDLLISPSTDSYS